MKTLSKWISTLGIFAVALGCSHPPLVAGSANPTVSANPAEKEAGGEILLKMADAQPLFSVCKEMNQAFDDAMGRPEKLKDPKFKSLAIHFIESKAADPSMFYQYRVPEMRAFLNWSDKAGENYWTLPDYKAQAEKALDGLQSALPMAKRVDLRSYYAAAIGRLMMARPSFAKNLAVRDTCLYIENSLEKGDDAELPVKMQELLKKAHVSPKEINFDPRWQSSMSVRDLGKLPEYVNTFFLQTLNEYVNSIKSPEPAKTR